MTDQEGEVEFLEKLLRNYRWIAGLGLTAIGIRRLVRAVCMAIGVAIGMTVDGCIGTIGLAVGTGFSFSSGDSICSNALLHTLAT